MTAPTKKELLDCISSCQPSSNEANKGKKINQSLFDENELVLANLKKLHCLLTQYKTHHFNNNKKENNPNKDKNNEKEEIPEQVLFEVATLLLNLNLPCYIHLLLSQPPFSNSKDAEILKLIESCFLDPGGCGAYVTFLSIRNLFSNLIENKEEGPGGGVEMVSSVAISLYLAHKLLYENKYDSPSSRQTEENEDGKFPLLTLLIDYSLYSTYSNSIITTTLCKQQYEEDQMKEFIQTIILFPSLASSVIQHCNSFGRNKGIISLPLWLSSSSLRYHDGEKNKMSYLASLVYNGLYTLLSISSKTNAKKEEEKMESYNQFLIATLCQRGSVIDVAIGIQKVWNDSSKNNQKQQDDKNLSDEKKEKIAVQFQSIMSKLLSPPRISSTTNSASSIILKQSTFSSSALSSRNIAKLISAVIRYAILTSSIPKQKQRISRSKLSKLLLEDNKSVMSFLNLSVLSTIQQSKDVKDELVRSMVLSSSSSSSFALVKTRGNTEVDGELDITQRCMIYILVLLLKNCTVTYKEDDEHSDSDEDSSDDDSSSSSEHSNKKSFSTKSALLHQLSIVTKTTWSQRIFLNYTNSTSQQIVTEFILSSLYSLLLSPNKDLMVKELAEVIPEIVKGVTIRLESSLNSERRDGMKVGELLSLLVDSEKRLRFEELDGFREEDLVNEEIAEAEYCGKKILKEKDANKNEGKKKKSKRNKDSFSKVMADDLFAGVESIDPDEEYNSSDDDDEDSSDDESSSNSNGSSESDSKSYASSLDDDSQWDEEDLTPYDLSDDEEDLHPVPTPHYLRDCLSYLRTAEDDNLAYDKHKAALTAIPNIITSQDKAMDVKDVAPTLALELLHKEDKFNMEGFLEKRRECMEILMASEPIGVTRRFVNELFGNVALGTRLEILNVIERVSIELCGLNALQKNRIEESHRARALRDGNNNEPKISGKRCLVKDQPCILNDDAADTCTTRAISLMETRTRRWGHGRRRQTKPFVVTNKFGPIAPLIFYPLLSNFLKSKSDTSIWGGANGSRLMASFLITLSTLLQSSGNYPGTELMAADLFDLAWSFRDAEIAEVRIAVLVAIATSIAFLPVEFLLRKLHEANSSNNGGLTAYLKLTATGDADRNCRQLAIAITENVSKSLGDNNDGDFGGFGMVERLT